MHLVDLHKLMVPICTRTGQVIEPMLTDQWFVAMNKVGEGDATGKSIAQKAIDAVSSGQVQFVNPYGYLPAYLYGHMPFWFWMLVSYGVAGAVWLLLSQLHHYFSLLFPLIFFLVAPIRVTPG